MQLYTNSIQDRYGNAQKGAQITVRTAAGALATLYSDNGVTLATNPLIADATGEFAFYAANGRYTFIVTATGMQAEIVSAFELQDALELQAAVAGGVASVAADRAQTGLDRVQTNLDKIASTGQADIATAKAGLTAADRVQTGLDRTAAAGSADAALSSKNAAQAIATTFGNVQGAVDAATVQAGNASASANASEVSHQAAVTQAGLAATAKTAAEAARDAAFVASPVKYTTEALGRAAVADGINFMVQGAGDVAAYEYRRTSSTVSVLIASYPSVAGIAAPYPFQITASAIPAMLRAAIKDVYVDAPNRSLRLAFHTVERGGSSGWYLRLASYDAADARNTTVGSAGIIATYLSASNPEPALVDGKRLQRITLTAQGTGAAKVLNQCVVEIDWEAITINTNVVVATQSYLKAGFSERVISGAPREADLLSRITLLPALPRKPSIWAKTNTFTTARLDQVFLDATLVGASPAKRYGLGPISYYYDPAGRIILWLSELNTDGTLGVKVALFDRTSGRPTAGLEGAIETVYMAAYNGSGVSASVKVNWSALSGGNGPNGTALLWSYQTMPATESELSVTGTSGVASITGYNVINFTLGGMNARLTTSDGYGNGEHDTLLLLFHGNTGSYTYAPSAAFQAWARANKVSYACIQGQDETTAPFTTAASGWGGDIHRNRHVQLYNYLMAHYALHRSVVLCGASMGGLVMGQLAYYQPFPIRFCLGIGPVPNLSYIFAVGGTLRKPPIRNAFGMASDGSQDSALETYIRGADWYDLGMSDGASPRKYGFPRTHLYAGDGDTTYTNDFGGATHYTAIKDSINRAGGFCDFTIVAGVPHADATLWDQALTDGVMAKELG